MLNLIVFKGRQIFADDCLYIFIFLLITFIIFNGFMRLTATGDSAVY